MRQIRKYGFRLKVILSMIIIGLLALWSAYYIEINEYYARFLRDAQLATRRQVQSSARMLSFSSGIRSIPAVKEYSRIINAGVVQNEEVLSEYSRYTGSIPDIAVQYMQGLEFNILQDILMESIDVLTLTEKDYAQDDNIFIPGSAYIVESPRTAAANDIVRVIATSVEKNTYTNDDLWLGIYIRGGEELPYDRILRGETISGAVLGLDAQYVAGAPIYDQNQTIIAGFILEYDITPNRAYADSIAQTITTRYFVISFIYIFLVLTFATLLFNPLKRLLHNANRLRQNDFRSRTYLKTGDELEIIGNSTDIITEKLRNTMHDIDAINRTHRSLFPLEYLSYLHKDNISELELGEYAERYVNILSINIKCPTILEREFTSSIDFVELVNDTIQYIGNIIDDSSGFIESFSAGALLLFFPHDSDLALTMAKDIQLKSEEWNAARIQNDKARIDFYLALHHGAVAFSIVGDNRLLKPYAASNAIEITKKLSQISRKIGSPIILTDSFNKNIIKPLNYQFRYLGGVLLGITSPIQIFEEIDTYPEHVKKLIVATKIDFEEAIKSFERNYLKRARRILDVLISSNPDDSVAASFMHHIQKHDVDA